MWHSWRSCYIPCSIPHAEAEALDLPLHFFFVLFLLLFFSLLLSYCNTHAHTIKLTLHCTTI